jgi:hypothetical protein
LPVHLLFLLRYVVIFLCFQAGMIVILEPFLPYSFHTVFNHPAIECDIYDFWYQKHRWKPIKSDYLLLQFSPSLLMELQLDDAKSES